MSSEPEEIEVKPFVPTNWYSEEGASKKMSALKKKGLPSFKDWRFVTLTVDQRYFKNAESSYFHIKERMRYFFRDLKSYLGVSELRYCWKLEFQKNGWAHWHCLIDHKQKLPWDDLRAIWKFGNVDVQRCKTDSLPYMFKYLTKGIDDLPDWFAAQKRPRVFQSSGLFVEKEISLEESIDQVVSDFQAEIKESLKTGKGSGGDGSVLSMAEPPRIPETLGERLKRYQNIVTLRRLDSTVPFQTLDLGKSFSKVLSDIIETFGSQFLRFQSAFTVCVPLKIMEYQNGE